MRVTFDSETNTFVAAFEHEDVTYTCERSSENHEMVRDYMHAMFELSPGWTQERAAELNRASIAAKGAE